MSPILRKFMKYLSRIKLIFDFRRRMAQQASTKLFKSLISECSKIPDFNFRNYFIRRVTDAFYVGQDLKDQSEIQKSLEKSKISLEMIQRQAVISQLYDENRKIPISK